MTYKNKGNKSKSSKQADSAFQGARRPEAQAKRFGLQSKQSTAKKDRNATTPNQPRQSYSKRENIEETVSRPKNSNPFPKRTGSVAGYQQQRRSGSDNRFFGPNTVGRYQQKNRPKTQAEWLDSPAAKRFGPNSTANSSEPRNNKKLRNRFPEKASFENNEQHDDVINQKVGQEAGADYLLTGRNPIREAIKTGRDLEKLMIAKGELTGSAREIVSMAKKAGVMIQEVERVRLDQLAKNHQGMIAFASAYHYASVDDILSAAEEKKEDPFIIVLDQVTDPHNLGAVIRTAVCTGAHGVIVPQHRAVGLTPSAVKASSGAVEHIRVARVTNLNQTIRYLQKKGVWFFCATPEGEDYRKVPLSGSCALVIGSEGEGVSKLTASLCDKQISVPMAGNLGSLNASVAAAVLMYGVFNTRNPSTN